MKPSFAAAAFALCFLLALCMPAEAAEVKVLSAFGMQAVMEDLGPKFEQTNGHKPALSFATGGAVVKRVQGGEVPDVVVTLEPGIEILVKEGKASAGSVTPIAQAGIVVAVRKGAPMPDISSPEALKRALLAAKSVSYVDPKSGGASGIHFAKVLDRLDIAAEMKPKTVHPDPSRPADVGHVVASGAAELGIHVAQELAPVADIEIVGPLPGNLQQTIVFSAAIMIGATEAAAAKALVDFLRTPEAARIIRAKGMQDVSK